MSIFNRKQILEGQVRELRANTETLTKKIVEYKEVQETLVKDILTLTEVKASYVGNEYRDYETAVEAIDSKYRGEADWGVLQTQTIIDLRAAFILGEGIRIVHTTETRAEAERELQWVEDFRRFNDLDGELDQEMAKEAEIEGKIAIKIMPDMESGVPVPYKDWPGMISARFISWLTKKYTIEADPNDYLWYRKLTWNATATSPAGSLAEDEFVYSKFGGRLNAPNDAGPKIRGCLSQIDRLDHALYDLRAINHLYASPTPYFKCLDPRQVEAVTAYVEKTNWKIGKALITMAEFSMVGADAAGAENLVKEIEVCVKMISGVTGIPIHYLGLLDLLKNRATGENTRELIMSSTTRERQIWISVYEELFTKAMLMWNVIFSAQKSEDAQLDPTRIAVEIPQITQEHWDRIEKVLIPAAIAGIISKEHVAEQIPGVDPEVEAARREEREAEEAEKAKEEMRMLQDRMDAKDEEET